MTVQIQFRRGTAAAWTVADTLLSEGELGLETDTGKFKVGNGVTTWNSLPYSSGAAGPTGPYGPQGDEGDVGPSGPPGPIGLTGTTGNTGATGAAGPAVPGFEGPEGEEGIAGPPGPLGPAGVAGGTGPTGPQGPVGQAVYGEDGDDGWTVPGPVGPAGPTGTTGNQGPAGSALWFPGIDGEDGEPGPPGRIGVDGAAGAAGPTGPVSPPMWLIPLPEEPDQGWNDTPLSRGPSTAEDRFHYIGVATGNVLGNSPGDVTEHALVVAPGDITGTGLVTQMTGSDMSVGWWKVEILVLWQSNVTTTGIAFALDFSGTATPFVAHRIDPIGSTTSLATVGIALQAADEGVAGNLPSVWAVNADAGLLGPNSGVTTINSEQYSIIQGTFLVTVKGNLQFQAAAEIAATVVRVRPGTSIRYTKLS